MPNSTLPIRPDAAVANAAEADSRAADKSDELVSDLAESSLPADDKTEGRPDE
jgi:hypothetical protein